MAQFTFGGFAQALAETTGKGVSFEGKAKNWGSESEAQEVVDAINACKVLEFLNLEGNTLGVDAANAIARALAKHPEFQRALWKDLFTGRLKTEIPQALESLGKGMITAGAHLVVLDCGDNALGPNGMKGLVDLLKSPTCYSLKELKLNNCGLGIQGGRMLADSLTACHEASLRAGTPFELRVFIAGRNRLENDGARALGAIFGKLQTLEEVAMPQNGINHDGIRALSDAFMTNLGLKVLNLNDNTITPKGAIGLAEAFEYLQNLVEINLGDCLLKSGGAILLGEALLDGHEQLKVLNLGFNEIGPNGGMSIVQAMQNKPNISSIILNGNMFGGECRDALTEMLLEYGKQDALGELDEDDSDNENADDVDENDEEYDDDDDDEDDEYGDSDTQDVGDEEYDGSTVEFNLNDLSQSFANDSLTNESQSFTSIESFCDTPKPTAAQFQAIPEPDKVRAFRQYLASLDESDYLIYLAFTILKCAAISNLCPEALVVSDALFKDCFEFARTTSQVSRVKTFFLTQLGLLLNEDKSFKPQYDKVACRTAVRHSIRQKTFSDDVASVFELFLERF